MQGLASREDQRTPGEVPAGLPLPDGKGKLFHALCPGLSLGLLGKCGCNCLGQQQGTRQEVLAVTRPDLIPSAMQLPHGEMKLAQHFVPPASSHH